MVKFPGRRKSAKRWSKYLEGQGTKSDLDYEEMERSLYAGPSYEERADVGRRAIE